ncbi:probable low affinity copper uptake protein 2 isoform X2 [Heterodontus francisci]|uniref:probable low affinity copper uptake protein 2 isoform X2 n=1 Tax=Heterodontus francisci TaxID=7792 RepID=UPI00355AD6F3
MPMHFFVSDQVILLFDFWNVHSVSGMVLTVVAVLIITVLYELLKVGIVKLDKRLLDLMTATPNIQDEAAETLPINPNSQDTSQKRNDSTLFTGVQCNTGESSLNCLVSTNNF